MSVGNWVRRSVFALAALAVGAVLWTGLTNISENYAEGEKEAAAKAATQQEVTTNKIARDCLGLQSFDRAICVGEALNAQHEAERSYRDLNAQNTMALIAAWNYLAVAVQALIGLGGIYYVARSLEKSAEAVALTKQAFVAENRPWLKVRVDITRVINLGGVAGCQADVVIENVGKAPAIEVDYEWEVIDQREDSALPNLYEMIDETKKKYLAGQWARHIVLPGDPLIETQASDIKLPDAGQREEDGGVKYVIPTILIVVHYRSPLDRTLHHTAKVIELSFGSKMRPAHHLNSGDSYGPDETFQATGLGEALAT